MTRDRRDPPKSFLNGSIKLSSRAARPYSTVEKCKATVIVHPQFGDLLHREYLRNSDCGALGCEAATELNPEAEWLR